MAEAPRFISNLLQGFGRLGNGQKAGLLVGIAAVIALVAGAWMWSRTPDYRVLYSNLSDRDGGAILTALQQQNVPYRMAEGGGAILVPSDQVYDVRLRLASQGLPRGGAVGFELMENQKLGTSQFVEQVNYQRALEGELARSIQSVSAVQGARVHLAIPRTTAFVRDQQKPSASIVVALFPGKVLDKAQISGIAHLVASSVPELHVKNVTMVDQSGNLLHPVSGANHAGLDAGQLDYLRQVEQSYVKRIEAILDPILGSGNVRAQVTADLDFSQVEQTAETYRPNPGPAEAAVRSEQSTETLNGADAKAAGVPGALSNQPPGAATAPVVAPPGARQGMQAPAESSGMAATGNVHRESTINYELDKTIRHVKQPVGSIKRLSVGVVVNHRKVTGKDGKTSAKPLAAEEMAQINSLVREAVGFTAARGDTVNVVNATFTIGEEEVVSTPVWKEPTAVALAKEIVKNLLIAGLVLFIVLGVLRPLLRELAKSPAQAARGAGEREGAEGEDGIVYQVKPKTSGYEENLQVAKEMAKQQPQIVAEVVREWVGKNE